ncbi:hypothetical protein [Aidingimonas lacisalsi]|uniref:hypothetical protein n=1 Tax=Aidingimonas lacisalsi TaxID=2604086 RepID=UPI0011D20348|nr:hypothetical protein [Aidingimonas lacisalsi]
MRNTTTARNMQIIVGLEGTQHNVAYKLGEPRGQSKISEYTRADKDTDSPDPPMIRRYEQTAGLPEGWFDRNNEWLLKISKEEFELVEAILSLDHDTQKRLLAFAQADTEAKES